MMWACLSHLTANDLNVSWLDLGVCAHTTPLSLMFSLPASITMEDHQKEDSGCCSFYRINLGLIEDVNKGLL